MTAYNLTQWQKIRVILTIEHIAKRHKEWLKMALSFNVSEDDAKDAVSEVYVKLCEMQLKEGNLNRIAYKEDVNNCYMYVAIRSRVFSNAKKNTEFTDAHIKPEDAYDLERDTYEQQNLDLVDEAVKELHWYNKRILELNQEMSVREIAAHTGIHYMSIYNTVKKAKEHVKKKIKGAR